MRYLTSIAALALFACGVPAFAQTDEQASPPASALCELHVWPGSGLRSTYHGWFHGGIVDGAVQGRQGYRKLPDQPLPTSRQQEILAGLSLTDLLGLPGYRSVLHDTALDSHTLRRSDGRLAPGTPACYAELAVDDVFFQEDIVDGRFIKVLFRFRKFDGGDAPSRTFGTYIQEKLTAFPPKSPDEDAGAALDELAAAYATVVKEFAAALNRPPKAKKPR